MECSTGRLQPTRPLQSRATTEVHAHARAVHEGERFTMAGCLRPVSFAGAERASERAGIVPLADALRSGNIFNSEDIARAREMERGRNRGAPDERLARNDWKRAAKRAALCELRARGNSRLCGSAAPTGAGAGDGAAESRTISVVRHTAAPAHSRGHHGDHRRKSTRGIYRGAGARELGVLAAAMGLGWGGG